MLRTLFFFIVLCFAGSAVARVDMIIPTPKRVTVLNDKLVKPRKLTQRIDPQSDLPAEGYRLTVRGATMQLVARDSAGMKWGMQTLEHLYVDGKLPQVEITDWPAYPMRAFMHDTGRNFLDVATIKEHIDLMSRYKLNVFHWHLTDYPAWRIESKVYPQLNDAKNHRKGRDEGKYYTYDEIRDVIAYAKERGVKVMPEIDMPGHSTFFNTTFGFSMDSPEGMIVLEKCIDELCAEIPKSMCPIIHIGSDEVHIKDPKGFMAWAEGVMKKHDRRPVAWDPGLPSSEYTIRQIWNEASAANSGAAEKGGDHLDSYMGYLNYYDPIAYTSRNYLHTVENGAIGGDLCVWNDVNVDDKTRIPLHSGMINGMMAFSEKFWGGRETTPFVRVGNLLPSHASAEGRQLAAFEKKMTYHRDRYIKPSAIRWVANASQPWRLELGDTTINAWGGAIDLDELLVKLNRKVDTMTITAYTTIYSDRDTVIRAWVGFDTPARSNRISAGIGQQGRWEADGQLFANGVEVLPAVAWKEPGAYKFHFNTWHKPQEEIPYTDEQFYWMREPAYVTLKKGANEIRMVVHKTFGGQRWSFAFIPVTVRDDGGVGEVEGVSFSKK